MILLNKEARAELKKGIDILADAVRVTLGPKGRNAVINTNKGPFITKDGVTVAQAVELEGIQKMGADLIKEAAKKTNEEVGDGTTTSTILAHSLITLGMKELETRNPLDIKKEIDDRVQEIVKELRKQSKKITTNEEIEQVASISANDPEIGKTIAGIIKEVGKDAIITAEHSDGFGITSETVKGMQFDRGTISPRLQNELKAPKILIASQKLSSISEIHPIMEKVANSGKKDLFIIAEDITNEALAILVLNNAKGNLNVVAVKAPGVLADMEGQLEDIARLTGATVIDGIANKFEDIKESDLGTCGRVSIKGKTTTIVDGKGDVSERVKKIKEEMTKTNPYEKSLLSQRLARLAGGVAVIKIGASSEIEAGEIKDRIEDAVNATKAAIEEGVVRGGGLALANLSRTGQEMVDKAITEPYKQIMENAGEEFEIKDDVIDATKVVITALENAASVASMILTTEVVINNKEL